MQSKFRRASRQRVEALAYIVKYCLAGWMRSRQITDQRIPRGCTQQHPLFQCLKGQRSGFRCGPVNRTLLALNFFGRAKPTPPTPFHGVPRLSFWEDRRAKRRAAQQTNKSKSSGSIVQRLFGMVNVVTLGRARLCADGPRGRCVLNSLRLLSFCCDHHLIVSAFCLPLPTK